MMKCLFGGAGIMAISLAFTMIEQEPAAANKTFVLNFTEDSLYNVRVSDLYQSAGLAESGLNITVFERALTGYYNLKKSGRVSSDKSILTIADFDQSSSTKRLWIIDLDKKQLLLNTWVAHGLRSGEDKATRFSNTSQSCQSSIGFYLTAEIYRGQHGKSLRLDGMDEGFNSNARKRAIVVHGADYVSQETIDVLGRLGRSQGCPAVATELADKVIDTIEGRTVLFINVSNHYYTSRYLDEHLAAVYAATDTGKKSPSLLPDTTLRI